MSLATALWYSFVRVSSDVRFFVCLPLPYSLSCLSTPSLSLAHAAKAALPTSQAQLVQQLKQKAFLPRPEVERIMGQVDRALFCPPSARNLGGTGTDSNPYLDTPILIGCGATMSSPHMHAVALNLLAEALSPLSSSSSSEKEQKEQHLAVRRKVRALDIGCGSGYLTTCLTLLLLDKSAPNTKTATTKTKEQREKKNETGSMVEVVGLDCQAPLVADCLVNVQKSWPSLLADQHIRFVVGSGMVPLPSSFSSTSSTPGFDFIHVGCAVPSVPEAVAQQLALNGHLLVPIAANESISNSDQKKNSHTNQKDNQENRKEKKRDREITDNRDSVEQQLMFLWKKPVASPVPAVSPVWEQLDEPTRQRFGLATAEEQKEKGVTLQGGRGGGGGGEGARKEGTGRRTETGEKVEWSWYGRRIMSVVYSPLFATPTEYPAAATAAPATVVLSEQLQEQLLQELDTLKLALLQWKAEFAAKHASRVPSASDMLADDRAKAVLLRHKAVVKLLATYAEKK